MNLAQALATLLYCGFTRRHSTTLHWATIEEWISKHGDRDLHGAGNFGGSLSRHPRGGFVELQRRPLGASRIQITAMLYFNPRQGAAARQTWDATALDAELEHRFGRKASIRIDV